MCITSGKIKVEVYVTPEELIELGKFLKKKKSNDIQTADGGEETQGGNK
jgi:hypothetical protein